MSVDDKCHIEQENHKWIFKGPCADDLASTLWNLFKKSERLQAEISAVACINSETGRVDRLEVDTIGDRTSTILSTQRVCPTTHSQISSHTHPESGLPRFSETDTETVIDRVNRGIDDGHCVIGKKEISCLINTILKEVDGPGGI